MHSAAMLIVFIWVIYNIVKKQELTPTVFQGKEDIIVKVLILAAVAFVVVKKIVPECMDLPYYNNNEYCYMEGVSQSHKDGRWADRGRCSVSIKNEDSGEQITVQLGYDGAIEPGDQLKVIYLPNSKHAILLEINGKRPD